MINKCCSEQRNALNSLKIRIVVLLAQANYVCLYCFDEDQITFYDFFFLGTDHLSDISSEEGKTHLFEEGMAY